MEEQTDKPKNEKRSLFWLLIAITSVVIAHYLYFLLCSDFLGSPNETFYLDNNITLEDKGLFGDFTAGHFSVLAFLWLAYGIYIQSKEFSLQRKEFKSQTNQFKKQSEILQKQLDEVKFQSTYNEFSRYVEELNKIESAISENSVISGNIYNYIKKRDGFLGGENGEVELIKSYIQIFDHANLLINIHPSLEKFLLLKKQIYKGLLCQLYLCFARHITMKDGQNQRYKDDPIYQELETVYSNYSKNEDPIGPYTLVSKMLPDCHLNK